MIPQFEDEGDFGGQAAFDPSRTLAGRREMGYLDRAREQNVSIEDMKKSLGKAKSGAVSMVGDLRAFSERTNQWAENFRNRK